MDDGSVLRELDVQGTVTTHPGDGTWYTVSEDQTSLHLWRRAHDD
ncbi:hypothetical protein [Nonomuraea dietziae]